MKQKIFNYNFSIDNGIHNFFVSNSNQQAYQHATNNNVVSNYCIIFGPPKSGKTHLSQIWKNNNNAIKLTLKNYNEIISNKNNIVIDNLFEHLNEESLFHIINHSYNERLKILITTDKMLSDHKFKLNDLSSRLKSFDFIEIHQPEDDLIINLILKLLIDRQIIINNSNIIEYILKRIDRTYKSINNFVDNADKLSLEKKRELTIPLIKELL